MRARTRSVLKRKELVNGKSPNWVHNVLLIFWTMQSVGGLIEGKKSFQSDETSVRSESFILAQPRQPALRHTAEGVGICFVNQNVFPSCTRLVAFARSPRSKSSRRSRVGLLGGLVPFYPLRCQILEVSDEALSAWRKELTPTLEIWDSRWLVAIPQRPPIP